MKVQLFGTRGSIPVAGNQFARYGGNTTSLQIKSPCLPLGQALVVDAGSGYLPLSDSLLKAGVMSINMIFTHYHSDHTVGFPMAPHTHIPAAHINIWGPEEHEEGPQEILRDIMREPHFPVNFAKIQHRVKAHSLKHIGTQVLVVHPQGGFLLLAVNVFESADALKGQLTFGGKHRFPIDECLVIRMYKTVHPEYTVSYRFEERPTGRVFVFLTDHENTAGFPRDLLRHLTGAHLLIQDAQYSQERYETMTAGFGHGTPQYCVDTAIAAKVSRLGLTHHDPKATDQDVEKRLEEAALYALNFDADKRPSLIFACEDFQELEV